MTKTDLLSMIGDSTLECEPNQEKRNLYEHYYPLIKATLLFCPANVELIGLSSIDEFEKRGAFEAFVISNDVIAIEKKFDAILTDLETFANGYARANLAKVRTVTEVMSANNEWQIERQRINSFRFRLMILLFIVFSVLVVVFTVLDACNIFNEGSTMAKVCSIIASVSGTLDFINGIAFFAYERKDDKIKRERLTAIKKALIRAERDLTIHSLDFTGDTPIDKVPYIEAGRDLNIDELKV